MKNKMVKRLLLLAACTALMGTAGVQAAETAGTEETAEAAETGGTEADGAEGETGAAEADGTTGDVEEEGNILQEMESANAANTLVEKHGKAAYQSIYYYADGTEESDYRYKDAAIYALENEYQTMIDEGGEVYGYNKEEAIFFRYLFVGDAYEEFSASEVDEPLVGYQYEESEKVISQEEKDGSLYVTTEMIDQEVIKSTADSFGYEADEVEKDTYLYQLDPATYEIQKMTHTFQLTDGTEKVLEENVQVEDPEDYVPEEQIKETVFAEDNIRTVTITADPGADQEQVYTQTITKGNGVNAMVPSDYDQTFYQDADCTTAYTGGVDRNEDMQLYVKSQAD